MVGTDKHRYVRGRRARDQLRPKRTPRQRELLRVGGKIHPDLVALGREVVEQHRASIRPEPSEEVALSGTVSSEASPQSPETDAELSSEGRPNAGMPERVGRIEHVGSSPQAFRIGGTRQEVSHQGFAGGNELIGQNVPGTDLQATVSHQLPDGIGSFRADSQVVLEQNRLAIEEKTSEAGVRLETGDQVVDGGNQPRDERGARQIPLAIPVRVGEQVKGVSLHRETGRFNDCAGIPQRRLSARPVRRRRTRRRSSSRCWQNSRRGLRGSGPPFRRGASRIPPWR